MGRNFKRKSIAEERGGVRNDSVFDNSDSEAHFELKKGFLSADRLILQRNIEPA
jgi:hypothetical protein